MIDFNLLDQFIAPSIRTMIEQNYYARINTQAKLQEALKDPLFLPNPSAHIALFADHGVVHVRDVAKQILQVLEAVNGVLIPLRDSERLAWMKSYGVLAAYAHDIGMVDLSGFGRAMHPEYATQAVLSAEFDDIFELLWEDDRGCVTNRLTRLAEIGAFTQPARVVMREMAAMANCHSKSKVSVNLLNDPAELRHLMQLTAATDLHYLFRLQRRNKTQWALENAQKMTHSSSEIGELVTSLEEAEAALQLAGDKNKVSRVFGEHLKNVYQDFQVDGFSWLTSEDGELQELVWDVVDTLRALRCADALRQRGTVLKTSGNYEVFVDQRSANAIYALNLDEEHLYLLEISDQISAGEANMASSELEKDGNLRISFQHGMYSNQEAILNAAVSAALVVNDIQSDVIESFQRPGGSLQPVKKNSEEIEILIENVDDNPVFADLICQQLQILNPTAAKQARLAPSLQASSALERARYLRSPNLDWEIPRRQEILSRIEQFGHKTEGIDPIEGFKEVRQVDLQAGETLIEAGSPAGFVYIPLGKGLRILPMGGYQAFDFPAWIPVGVTGVIRGAIRNAKVVAEQNLSLLAIPKDVFLKYWHHTYTPNEFAKLFNKKSDGRQ